MSRRNGEHDAERHAADLLKDFPAAARDLDLAADTAMADAVRAAWEAGWMPSDLHEIARRRIGPSAVEYLDAAIILESKRYAVATLHPRWRADLAVISTGIEPNTQTPQMERWAVSHAVHRCAALAVVLEVLALLGTLPVLEPLLPLPGACSHNTVAADDVDEKALARVRALLAKAEATEFPEEAEALSAKAQELMSRYSLHQTVADHDYGRVRDAAAQRIWIDSPYAGAKALLVQAVAEPNRCRTVWTEDLGFVTVVGSETDLNLVELLTTSLLVQANRAMPAGGRPAGRGPTRTRSFRQSFLLAYATRIGERLDTTNATVTAEVADSRLLPVLAARSRAADELTGPALSVDGASPGSGVQQRGLGRGACSGGSGSAGRSGLDRRVANSSTAAPPLRCSFGRSTPATQPPKRLKGHWDEDCGRRGDRHGGSSRLRRCRRPRT
jgi:Protein of unknown function (DUF2786)